ncbi:MAG: bifunctional heptose 7-phosphate kinase/heptose 1-phosphate adenyltransferase [Planctomycetota bacterium]
MNCPLSDIVRSFPGRRVLVVGDFILDQYVYGDAERISPEAPVPVLRVVESSQAVGGSANVSACISALGSEVTCCGMVGDDPEGECLVALIRKSGGDPSGVRLLQGRKTTIKTRMIGLAQHRHRQQLLRVDREDTTPLSEEHAGELCAAAVRFVSRVDVVCLEDYDKGVISRCLVEAVVAEARKSGKQVLVDPARLSDYGRYRGVDVITPNRAELSLVSGRTLTTMGEVAEAAQKLRKDYDIRFVVATVDRDGSVLVTDDGTWKHLPTTPRAVYDNTGAGDAVLAMLAASLAAGADLESATRLANIAGGLEVEKFGCVPIRAEEILAELRLGAERRNGKLRSSNELVAELARRRDRGETIAFTNGCFDILHAGHVDFLRRCREEASVLVVGLNSDASVKSLGKGPDRPVNGFADRASVLGALDCVDYVVGFDEPDPELLIHRVRPDVLVKGEDWAGRGVKGREFVEAGGGRVVLLPLLEGRSTTNVIERIRSGAPS